MALDRYHHVRFPPIVIQSNSRRNELKFVARCVSSVPPNPKQSNRNNNALYAIEIHVFSHCITSSNIIVEVIIVARDFCEVGVFPDVCAISLHTRQLKQSNKLVMMTYTKYAYYFK